MSIRALAPEAKVIIVTAIDGEEDILRGLRAGAKGYILKDAPDHEIVNAVLTTMQGRRTVKFHVNNILSKLQCASRTEAVAAAVKRGLIQLTP